ncbi:MAG: MFS transporter [Pseudomonadota bacterium]
MSELKPTHSQFALMRQRRFAALFHTQFLGAFNDNVFKAALSLIFVYSGMIAADATDTFVNAAAGLFILPFFLFSATAGQLADKLEKSQLVRSIKLMEIVIALFGAVAVYLQNVYAMLFVLFLLGVQSTFFGPLKFSILPQQLDESELIGGNAQIEMGTFVAILLGTIVGGIVAVQADLDLWLTALVGGIALLGYIASRFIPECPATEPELKVDWNPFRATWRMVQDARGNHSVFLAILGISWFWLLGSVLLAQIPNLTKVYLQGGATVVTLILATFTIAVAVGSLMCERLSGHKIELGIVPLGAIGLSLAGLDLYFAISALDVSTQREWLAFAQAPGAWRLLLDTALIGFFGGLFIVPLYALIQTRTAAGQRARIIAVNNVFNAIFMVAGAALAIVCLGIAGMSIPDFLLMIIVMNVAVSAFVFQQVPEFAMRFLIWMLSHTMYRVQHDGLQQIPEEGPAVIVCNHVTFVDALLLAGAVRRPIRFIMFKPIYDIPVLNFVFRVGGAIPIQAEKENKAAFDEAFVRIRETLAAGELVCIFPEGALTRDGEIAEFRRGVERIVRESQVPVVPMALQGLWGSFFSHSGGVFKNPSRFWSRVRVRAGGLIAPAEVSAERLQAEVQALRGDAA